MPRRFGIVGLLVSLSLAGVVAVAAPSGALARAPKCKAGYHYDSKKKKCVKNKKTSGGGKTVNCGRYTIPGAADSLTAKNISCVDAQAVGRTFQCNNPRQCTSGHATDTKGRAYTCSVVVRRQPRVVRLMVTCRHQPGALEASFVKSR
jgi:hypothetical protein